MDAGRGHVLDQTEADAPGALSVALDGTDDDHLREGAPARPPGLRAADVRLVNLDPAREHSALRHDHRVPQFVKRGERRLDVDADLAGQLARAWPPLLVTMSHAAQSHDRSGTFVFAITVPAVTEAQWPHFAHSSCLRLSRS